MTKKVICDVLFVLAAIICGFIVIASVVLAIYVPKYIFDRNKVEPSAEVTEEITVMSSNVRFYNPFDFFKKSWFYRASLFVEDLNNVKPDVVGFQEVTYLHYNRLTKRMPDYESVMAYRDDFFLSEGCPIFYRTDKFEKVDSGSFWLSETPEVMSKDWDSEHYRICVYVILKDVSSGKQFIVFNTHLDNTSDDARVNGIKVVLNKIDEIKATPEYANSPCFLMGDLNAEPGSVTVNSALEHFDDTARLAGVTEDAPTFHGWGDESREKRLDYILASKGDVEVSEYKVYDNLHDKVYSSDHYPIYIKVKFK